MTLLLKLYTLGDDFMQESTFIALLRGINVGGHNRIPMADLRRACDKLGWSEVRTYIQSGNLIVRTAASAAAVEDALEQVIKRRFGLTIPVVVRSAAQWAGYYGSNPFPEESRTQPNLVMLALSKLPPRKQAAAELQERAASGERVALVAGALWIHFRAGAGQSKLAPALFDRLVGSPVTVRNWRTVLKLNELAAMGAGSDVRNTLPSAGD